MSDIVREGDRVIVRPGKDIVASAVQELREELRSLVDKDARVLTIDLSGVSMVDSVGLGLLIATHNSFAKRGSKLEVIHASRDIHDLFKTMRLDKHFDLQWKDQS
jgi:anti-anti-sigma factor